MRKVREIMSQEVVTVTMETSVQDVCRLLRKHDISGVPVLDEKWKLKGYLSERDIIAAVTKKDFLKKKAADLMVRRVICVQEDTNVEEASRIFTEHAIRNVPVTRKGKVIGSISRKDLIGNLLGSYY